MITLPTQRVEAIRRNPLYRVIGKPLIERLSRVPQDRENQDDSYSTVQKENQVAVDQFRPPNAVADTPEARDLLAKVTEIEWYHTIELSHGVVTPGIFDHRPYLQRYRLPERLDGQKALDVATYNGFWAFELEKRGAAEVVAIDLEKESDLDLPFTLRQRLIEEGTDDVFGKGFQLAKGVLNSNVQRVVLNVYDLQPNRVGGQFDFIYCGDLLIHLMNPPKALQSIQSVSAGDVIFGEVFDPNLDALAAYPITRYLGGWNRCTWWMPSLNCLVQMISDAGFSTVEVLDTFEFSACNGGSLWRAVIRARIDTGRKV
jgi:tRNA (mo5U34)-methyltransferase